MYEVRFSPDAEKDLSKLEQQTAKRIVKFLHERIANIDDPRALGKSLKGEELGKYWRYSVGDYRIICEIQDNQLVVLVITVGHRRDIYRH